MPSSGSASPSGTSVVDDRAAAAPDMPVPAPRRRPPPRWLRRALPGPPARAEPGAPCTSPRNDAADGVVEAHGWADGAAGHAEPARATATRCSDPGPPDRRTGPPDREASAATLRLGSACWSAGRDPLQSHEYATSSLPQRAAGAGLHARMIPVMSLAPRLRRAVRDSGPGDRQRGAFRDPGRGRRDRRGSWSVLPIRSSTWSATPSTTASKPGERRRNGKPAEGTVRLHPCSSVPRWSSR